MIFLPIEVTCEDFSHCSFHKQIFMNFVCFWSSAWFIRLQTDLLEKLASFMKNLLSTFLTNSAIKIISLSSLWPWFILRESLKPSFNTHLSLVLYLQQLLERRSDSTRAHWWKALPKFYGLLQSSDWFFTYDHVLCLTQEVLQKWFQKAFSTWKEKSANYVTEESDYSSMKYPL